jgi:Uma2 family endonuclease
MTTSSKTAHLRITPQVKRMTLERWQKWKPIDGWKYDWTNGETIKYKRRVSQEQRYIVSNIQRLFTKKSNYPNKCILSNECEVQLSQNKFCVPDFAYFTTEQDKLSSQGIYQMPSFIIEICSDDDFYLNLENKLWEYFEAGVKVVWHIIPYKKIVKVYTSPFDVKILKGSELCSAAPALDEFQVNVSDVFAL